jgi:tetratricopeptide (TPR) repeat protein
MAKNNKNRNNTAPASIHSKSKPEASHQGNADKGFRYTPWLYAISVILLTLVLYSNTFHHRFVLDDHGIIKNNKITKAPVSWQNTVKIFSTPLRKGDFSDIENSLYRPAVKFLFNIEWNLFSGDPHSFHVVNVLLYALCGAFLFFIFYDALREQGVFPFLIALLFITHPIHTEVVANIKSGDEVLSLLGILMALRCLQLYTKKNQLLYLPAAILSFLLGSFSKESTVVAVLIFPLFLYFFTDIESKKNAVLSTIMLSCSLFFLLCRYLTLNQYPDKSTLSALDNFMVLCNEGSYVGTHRFSSAVNTLGLYLKTFLFPHPLSCDYSYSALVPVGFANPGFLFSFFLLLAMFGYAVYSIAKKSEKNPLAFGILWFFIAMSITSNIFFLIGTSFGERLLFVPSLGLTLILVFGLAHFFYKNQEANDSLSAAFRKAPVFLLMVFAIAGLYSFKTYDRNKDWKSDFSLFSKDVESYPESTHLLFYMGNHLSGSDFKDNLELDISENNLNIDLQDSVKRANYRAIELLSKSLSIFPALPSDGYNQLGKAYFNTGRLDSAEKYYRKALDQDSTNPIFTNNLGTVFYNASIPITQKGADFQKMGMTDSARFYLIKGTNLLLSAMPYFLKAHKGDSTETDFINNIGCIYGATQRPDSALYWFNKAYALDPLDEVSIQFLDITYRATGKVAEADYFKNRLQQARAIKADRLR